MRIYLRPVDINDGSLLVRWRNSPDVKRHCFDKSDITIESNMKFYREMVQTGKYLQFIVERIEEYTGAASYPIATVYLKDIDKVNKRCELCIFTSNDEEWNTESQSLAIKSLVKKAFKELKMHKIYTYVFSDNMDEIQLMKDSGFSFEAVLIKEARNLDDTYSDIIRLSITNVE